MASLYNASCIAANYPDVLSMLPSIALQFPLPSGPGATTLGPSNIDLSGHHFFADKTTAVFNMDANPQAQVGVALAHKVANSTAPPNAPKGPGGVGNGAVAWLQLQTIAGTTGAVKTVYRLNTAGGSPPTTCANMPAQFSLQYAAEYWFWSSD